MLWYTQEISNCTSSLIDLYTGYGVKFSIYVFWELIYEYDDETRPD